MTHLSHMPRDEFLAAIKKRALEYLDRGDLHNAVASMTSDLSKHEDFVKIGAAMAPIGLFELLSHSEVGVRRWIEGFN